MAAVILAALFAILCIWGLKLFEGLILLAYPSLKSIEAIEVLKKNSKKRRSQEQTEFLLKWLAYWGIYGLWIIVEGLMPNPSHAIYVMVKILVFLFLMLPQTDGALILQKSVFQPIFLGNMNRLNRAFEEFDEALQDLFSPITSLFCYITGYQPAPSVSKPAVRLR